LSSKHAHQMRRSNESPEPNGANQLNITLIEGLIVDGSRGQYRVETAQGAYVCTIRGRLRKQLAYPTSANAHRRVQDVKVIEKDPVAVGDRVRILPTGSATSTTSATGVIEEIVARAGGAFTRDDPDDGGGALTTVAGLDQMVMVFAARDPEPHLRLLDRLLVLAEAQEMAVAICLNKVDLGLTTELAAELDVYRRIGYPVVLASASDGSGLDELRALLAGRVSAFVGPSGVGKSSLLNAIQPELGQRVSTISSATHKGRHTTTGTRLFPLDGPDGGYIADTAGIRALALVGGARRNLDWCFREFRPYLGACRLSDCTHLHEPDCAVRAAVRTGTIHAGRYDSYHRLATDGRSASPAADELDEIDE
jgi:ribosome biogenesis GTPase